MAIQGSSSRAPIGLCPASLVEDYGDRRDAWDTLILAGRVLPGRSEVSGPGLKQQMDIHKVPGRDAAKYTDNGHDVGRFHCKLTLWAQDQWRDFLDARPIIRPLSKANKPQPVDVVHPSLNALGIVAAYIEEIGVPHFHNGLVEINLIGLDYRKASTADVTNTPKRTYSSVVQELDPNAPNYTMPNGDLVRIDAARPSNTNTGP